MMRHGILAVAALAALIATPGFSQDYEADIMAQLRGQGYQGITLSHTWLGRSRIVAMLDGDLREIVFDPNTGEILRDLSRLAVAGTGADSDNDGGQVASAAPASGAASAAATNTRVGAAAATMAGVAGGGAGQGQPGLSMGIAGAPTDVTDSAFSFQILQPNGGK